MKPRCYIAPNAIDVMNKLGGDAIASWPEPTEDQTLGMYDAHQVAELLAILVKVQTDKENLLEALTHTTTQMLDLSNAWHVRELHEPIADTMARNLAFIPDQWGFE